MVAAWLIRGWDRFEADRETLAWCRAAREAARGTAADPEARARWLRHGATWFAGVDVLPNDARGRIAGGPELGGAALSAAQAVTGRLPLHRAQVSITYPGYPRQDESDSDAAFRYRARRDAAHLDGLLPEGDARRRHLREPHAYILGLALTEADPDAAPLVVYEGSHDVFRAVFQQAFSGRAPEAWAEVDVTEIYQDARRRCFETCPRVEVPLRAGEAVLVHRLTLHGVAPWNATAKADPDGRAIAYFRPQFTDVALWLSAP